MGSNCCNDWLGFHLTANVMMLKQKLKPLLVINVHLADMEQES